MVLAGDVTFARGKVQGRNVVSPVTVLELDGSSTGSKSQELVAQADPHDGDLGCFHQLSKMVHRVLAVGWVTGTVGDEDTVKVVSNLVDRVVEGEGGHAGATTDEAAQDVLLDTAVDDRNVGGRRRGADVKRCLGADFADEIDLFGINEGFVLILVVFFSNSDSGQTGTLLPQIGDDGSSVHSSDGGHTLPGTPLTQAFHRSPVGIFLCNIRNNHSHSLDVRALEILQKSILVPGVRGDPVVTNEGLGENQNLASV